MLALALTGEPDDERRPERRGGLGRADGVDAGEEAVAAPPPLHAPQEARVRVLQREVEVRDDRRQLQHGGDERVAHLAGIEVEEADPRQAVRGERVESPEQRGERARRPDVAPVPGEVLRHQHQLGDALLDQAPCLRLDGLGGARALLAAERRDGAEGAGAVAPLRHLQVRPRDARRGPGQLQQVTDAPRLAFRGVETDGRRRAHPRRRSRRPRRPRAAPPPAPRRSARPCTR